MYVTDYLKLVTSWPADGSQSELTPNVDNGDAYTKGNGFHTTLQNDGAGTGLWCLVDAGFSKLLDEFKG